MEKGSCSRNSPYNRRVEVASGLDSVVGSVSFLNVSLDKSNRNREVVNAEARRKRYRFRYPNRHPVIVSDEEDDDDEEYVINKRGSSSAQKRRNPNKRRRNHRRRKSTLRARNSRGLMMIQETQKRSITSWLIDSGTVQLDAKVCYMNWTSKRVYGNITREGIFCSCCQTIVTISKFEAHSGGRVTDHPFKNIFIDNNISLFQCQINAWNKLREKCQHNRPIINYEGDSNDDTCGVCGDGGNLICCDACPSTFHQNCLGIEVIPQGDWYCPLCLCKYCELVGFRGNSLLLTCRQCEQKFHEVCIQEEEEEEATSAYDHNGSSFCGKSCRQLFEQLQNLVGIKFQLENGITWSLIRCLDNDLATNGNGLYKRTQYNSTLATALAVMEECFDPIIDCRTGINVIRNIICNSGSNLRRLNFSGFYTAVLERGDEILSAASIRIHGTRLAEMPFIGTRNKFRRQGMCRLLLNAIESAFRLFGVEKIIIPSISDRVNNWINSYGFEHIEEPLKHEMRTMNLLAFPETVQLQKVLLINVDVNDSANRAAPAEDVELRANNRLLVPRPFDLNQPSEEDESAILMEESAILMEESANNELHCSKSRPTHGIFIVLNIQEGTIGYQRVQ